MDPHRSATDLELVTLHQSGDPGALASLLRRYRRFRKESFRVVTRGDDDQAEQLWSEVALRVLRGIWRFDARQPVANWLNTIISNVARNELRRQSRCRLVYTAAAEDPVPWGSHHPIHVPSVNRLPDDDAYIAEVGRALSLEIGALPPGLVAAVWLSHGEGRRLNDLSLALGVARSTAKTRRWRGARIAEGRLRARLGLPVGGES